MTLRTMGKQAPTAQSSAWGIINTFKTLPDIQGRTVGALVGALLADAAVRPMQGLSPMQVQEWQKQALEQEAQLQDQLDRFDPTASLRGSSSSSSSLAGGAHYATTFGGERISERHSVTSSGANAALLGSLSQARKSPILFAQPNANSHPIGSSSSSLASSSFSGQTMRSFLKGMLEAKGAPLGPKNWQPLMEDLSSLSVRCREQHIASSQVQTLPGSDGSGGERHVPLLPLVAALSLVGTYPYCDDDALRAYADPFLDLMCQVPDSVVLEGEEEVESADQQLGKESYTTGELGSAERTHHSSLSDDVEGGGAAGNWPVVDAVRPLAHSYLSLLMRYIQVNPDPLKNAALRSAVGSQAMFPASLQKYCPDSGTSQSEERSASPSASAQSDGAAAAEKLGASELQRVLEILSVATSYEEGVHMVAMEGGPVCCEKAMLVGACLGAKVTARFLPGPWIQQVADHGVLCSNAIAVGQLAWNPHQ